ncbi:LegC2/C7 family Dot/Icm T4SS effector [Legionella fallonii]|uniref:Substrate of the Dot/Icm secretion system [5 coiled-coil domains] n=1 Tax=Legionella fallonii LLAP-10 TaxID=1212491 RepID=A0A098G9H1_9GAMM|nr:LegC2/C7 family Dot/Icm T4SS effector [Legionella fallonii]CEG59123.1 substrate of the Dot/Icm secretion system [5 coiled-coil domains] [Legionella fallonii LLAP-10]
MTYQKLELELVSSLHQSENMEQDDLNQKTKKDKERFEKIVTTQNKIQKIKADLNQLIQAMNQNPSLLSRAASFWNEIPLWQKITAGVVLTVPLLMIGLMANLVALITLSIVTGIVYTASHILLENHQSQNTDNIEGLKAGISSLADLLDSVISILELLREQLAIEIDAFQKKNTRLTVNIEQFSEQIKSLKSQINELTDTEKALRATQIELELTAKTLKGSIEGQSQALENTQKELEQVVKAYKENQNQLSDKIKELDDIKEKMGKEVEQARAVGLVLSGTVKTFSNIVIQDKEQRAAFQKRLEEFLNNKEKSFVEVADRICEAEHKLSVVTKQLEESNQRYRKLLDRQEQQIIRLEQMNVYQSDEVQESFDGVRPSINGFYAIKKEPPFLPEPIHGAAIFAVV